MKNHSSIMDATAINCKRAWLVTWEWEGDHARVEKKLVAILNYRYAVGSVGRFIEQLYAGNWFAFHGQLAYAKDRRDSSYNVQQGAAADELKCGGNPWLRARPVYDVQAYVDEDGYEHLTWREHRADGREGWVEGHLTSAG